MKNLKEKNNTGKDKNIVNLKACIEKLKFKLNSKHEDLSKIEELNLTNEKYKLRIKLAELDIELLSKNFFYNNLGYNKGDFVYIRYLKNRGESYLNFSNLGFIVKESINHIKLLVYDQKRESAHKYSIHKDMMLGIKHYDGQKLSVITYEELIELWEKNKK